MRFSGARDRALLSGVACVVGLIGPASAAAADPDIPSVYVSEFRGGSGSPRIRVELRGRSLHYRKDDLPVVRITPTPGQWRAFRRALDEADVWSWKDRYETRGADVPAWSLKVVYPDRSMASGGVGSGPGEASSTHLWAEQTLLGGRCVCGRTIEPLERFKLTELRLVATHPSRIARERWASIRDPAGKVHRVRMGSYLGRDYGVVREINAHSVLLKELVHDELGDWVERTTTMSTP